MIIKFKNSQVEFEISGEVQEVQDGFDMIESLLVKTNIPIEETQSIATEIDTNNLKPVKAQVIKPKSLKTTKAYKPKMQQLNIPDERKFIEEFNSFKGAKSITQKIYVLVYLLKQQCGIEIVNADIVHSLLHLAQIDTPKSLKQMLTNYVNQEKTFDKTDDGQFKMKFQTADNIIKLKNEIIK